MEYTVALMNKTLAATFVTLAVAGISYWNDDNRNATISQCDV